MANQYRVVGRVVQLRSLLSNPELNEKYAIIRSYFPDSDLYDVQILATADKCGTSTIVSVNHGNLNFCTSDSFSSKYPAADVARYFEPGFSVNPRNGCILEMTDCSTKVFTLTTPVYVRGEEVPFDSVDNLRPKTTLTCGVHVNPADENTPIVIEDIHFAQTGDGKILCSAGKDIIFRRCKFTVEQVGMFVGRVDKTELKVVCESCLFENSRYSGIIIGNTSQITLLNCIVRNVHHGVNAELGGTIKMTHTTINGTIQYAARSLTKTGRIVATNCSIIDNKGEGISTCAGSSAVIRGCYFLKCMGMAIEVEGPKSTTAHIEDTFLSECASGVFIRHGKVKVSAVNVEVTKCTLLGFCVSTIAAGDVTVNNCHFHDSIVDFENTSGPTCTVTIDGVKQRQDDQLARIELSHVHLSEEHKAMTRRSKSEVEQHWRTHATLQQLRALKQVVGFQIKCANCTIVEGKDEKFKACSKCKEVCYCSKDCQVGHWKEHRKTCGIPPEGRPI